MYRDDLGLSGRVQRCTQHPDNVWALHGLVECLERRGETRELPALRLKLSTALQKADIPITSSCMCRTGTADRHGVLRNGAGRAVGIDLACRPLTVGPSGSIAVPPMAAIGVRREKAALSSGCKAHPAIRSSRKQSEQSWR